MAAMRIFFISGFKKCKKYVIIIKCEQAALCARTELILNNIHFTYIKYNVLFRGQRGISLWKNLL